MAERTTATGNMFSEKELQFIRRIPAAAKELGLPPGDAIKALGRVVRLLAEYEQHLKGIPLEQAVATALDLFMAGLGANSQIEVGSEDPDTPPKQEMH